MLPKYAEPIEGILRADVETDYADVLAEVKSRFRLNGNLPDDWPGDTSIWTKAHNRKRKIRQIL